MAKARNKIMKHDFQKCLYSYESWRKYSSIHHLTIRRYELNERCYNSFIKVILNWTLFWKRLLRNLPSLRIWIHTLVSFDLRLNTYDNKIKVMIRLYNHFWNELLISWIERLIFVWELIWVVHNIVFFAEVNHTLFNHNQHVFTDWW